MRVLFAAGGTAGHINPALSAAQELRRRYPDAAVLFIGTKEKMESTLVPKAGFDFESIDISGFQRSFSPADTAHNLQTLKKLLFVTGQCRKIISAFNPDVVVGFGGYVSGPVVRTAHKMGIKTAIHEQNAFPGKTNIALSKYADAVMLASQNAAKHLKCSVTPQITGMPVRKEILCAEKTAARKALGFTEEARIILSTGGSLGAQAINDCMCRVIADFDGKDVYFVHGYGQLGRFVPDKLKELGVKTEGNPKLRVSEYIYDIALYMAAADIVVSRAGASSLAEIQALGKASVLVPSPYVSENHQYHNAMALAEKNAAVVVRQSDFNAEKMSGIINDFLSEPEKYNIIGRNARNMAICDAQKHICDIFLSLIEKK